MSEICAFLQVFFHALFEQKKTTVGVSVICDKNLSQDVNSTNFYAHSNGLDSSIGTENQAKKTRYKDRAFADKRCLSF
ncbi:MAG: hypothetical protein CL692_04310 [Cellvibrionales bacterium]|nr:hypothetical protein [Cellvibrionales bacterium]